MTTPAHDLARSRRMLTEDDVDLIIEAVNSLHNVSTLHVWDLGAGSGTTAAAVRQARWLSVRGTTVDISQEALDWSRKFMCNSWRWAEESFWDNRDPDWPRENPMSAYWQAIDEQNDVHWRWVLADSAKAMAFGAYRINLLLVDSSHEYEHTKSEIIIGNTRIAEDGLIWLHDYVGNYPGVTQAVDEEVASGRLEIIEQRGLGILCKYRHAG